MMNVSIQPRFGRFSQQQLSEMEKARINSSGSKYTSPLILDGGDTIEKALEDIVNPQQTPKNPDEGLEALPEIDAEKSQALITALKKTIVNGFMGPLDPKVAQEFRSQLDSVMKQLHKADFRIPQELVKTIAEKYGVAYLFKRY